MRTDRGPALSKRLETVKNAIGECGTFADIGSDHALLPVRMVIDGHAGKAIVTDLRKGPLETAAGNIDRYCPGLKDRFSLRQGSGLSVLKKGEAEVKAICGMGGLLIEEIIENDFDIASEGRLVLQPNTSLPELRVFLLSKGFEIKNETGICDAGHSYAVIDCVYTGVKRTISEDSIEALAGEFIGRDRDPEGVKYLKALRRRYEIPLAKINEKDDAEGPARDFAEKNKRQAELESVILKIDAILGDNK